MKSTHHTKSTHRCKYERKDCFLIQDIINIIASLDRIDRIPFVMRHKRYSYKEISDYLGIPIGTVRSMVFTSRTYLRDQINAKYDEINSSKYKAKTYKNPK